MCTLFFSGIKVNKYAGFSLEEQFKVGQVVDISFRKCSKPSRHPCRPVLPTFFKTKIGICHSWCFRPFGKSSASLAYSLLHEVLRAQPFHSQPPLELLSIVLHTPTPRAAWSSLKLPEHTVPWPSSLHMLLSRHKGLFLHTPPLL